MDEIHAVLELFVSCRGSGWPLVRLEAEQQLLAQHLLMVRYRLFNCSGLLSPPASTFSVNI